MSEMMTYQLSDIFDDAAIKCVDGEDTATN